MRHPTDGTLRRLVDEPAGVPDADREHVADCAVCLTELAAVQEDATITGAALHVDPTTDVDVGWHRLSGAVAAEEGSGVGGAVTVEEPPRIAKATPAAGRRAALRRPVIAAAGVVVVLAGAGAAAAADWLQIFRTEQIAPVTLTQADLVELPDLSAYGKIRVTEEPDVHEVANAAAAEEATGLSVPRVVELPAGVMGDPVFQVGDEVSAVFTFSAEEAGQAAAAAGEKLPRPPPALDGTRFRLVAGPGIATVWSEARGLPAMVVARAIAPTAYSSGIPFATARDYLLSLPGLPEGVASQLRSYSGGATTLPLPVPARLVSTSAADVAGVPATVFTSRDGTIAGVVWVDDGVVTAVAGSLSADEVLSVARGLRYR